jgi:hypothetical protein
MAESGVIFDRKTAERVGRATKWVENQPVDLTGTPSPKRPPSGIVWVEIVATLTGEGAYSVIIGKRNTSAQFDPASDGADWGYTYTPPDGETFNAYLVNQAEEGKTPHWFDVGGHYPAWFDGVATDGLPVLRTHSFDTQLCEEEA